MLAILIILLYRNRTRELGKVVNISTAEISRAYIVNGHNGNITDLNKEETDLIYGELKKIKVKPMKAKDTDSWNYSINFECGDNSYKIVVKSDSEFHIDNDVYGVSGKDGDNILNKIKQIVKDK